MFSPVDLTGFSEIDFLDNADMSFLQGGDGLEDLDFNSFEMPTFAPFAAIEASPTPTAVQSPKPSPPPVATSPPPQPRRTSIVTVQRRSSPRSKEAVLSVTHEDPNGRKRSVDITVDNDYADLLQNLSPGMMKFLNQDMFGPSSAQPMPYSSSVPLPTMPVAQQSKTFTPRPDYDVPYVPLPTPGFQFAGQQDFLRLQPSMPPPAPRYTGHVPPTRRSGRVREQRPTMPPQRQLVSTRATRPIPQRQGIGGRPPLPDDIEPFVNPGQLPQNHGRVPDKRGNKDTTVANDFYYSVSALGEMYLRQADKTVAYSGVEFEPNLRFEGLEFLEYLLCAATRPNRHPILRIQIQPAQYNHRYKRAGESFKCRFSACPVKKGTILKGQARVCISEFNDEHGDWLNPFHNAGYVHLDCLEKQVNFIELYHSQVVAIIPETRALNHEPPATLNVRTNNPMALNDIERTVVHEWFEEMNARWEEFQYRHPDPALRPAFVLEQKDSLTYRLTKAHGDNKILKRVQERRKRQAGGRITAHLDDFVGDLGKQVALHKKMKKQPPKKKAGERRESVVSSASRQRRITPPVHSATPLWHEAQAPLPAAGFLAQGNDVYDPLLQASYDTVGASYPPLTALLQYDGQPSATAAEPEPNLTQPAEPIMSFDEPPFPDTVTLELPSFPAPVYVPGRPRHAQRRPSPIKVVLSPSRRRSPRSSAAAAAAPAADTVLHVTVESAGVNGGRRRSSARLAARSSASSSNSSGKLGAVVRWLGEEAVMAAAEAGQGDMDSLFGDFDESRIEEIE